jgi:predicted acetyltransferase
MPTEVPPRAHLTLPDAHYHASFLRALREYQSTGAYLEVLAPPLADPDEFTRYVAALRDDARNGGSLWRYLKQLSGRAPWHPPGSGWAPQTAYWWVAGDEYLGRLNLRHFLTEDLLRRGGHIGYDVRPSARRRGHATSMLAAALPLAAAMGIDPAHIDCDVGNTASRRVIEKNGGVFEREQRGAYYFLLPTRSERGAGR